MNFKDTADMALNGEYLAGLLDEYLDVLIEKNDLKKPTIEEVELMRKKVLKKLQAKYPNAGIVEKKDE